MTADEIARDPIASVEKLGDAMANPRIAAPCGLFAPGRRNAKGWDLTDPLTVDAIETARAAVPDRGLASGSARRWLGPRGGPQQRCGTRRAGTTSWAS